MRFDFLFALIGRRLTERYIGTSSRLVWVVVAPILPLLFNILVFYFIARLPQVQDLGVAGYAAFVFSGLLPFRVIQRACQDSCDLFISNMEMLKSAVFPLPFLSLAAVGGLLFEFSVQSAVMMVLFSIAGLAPSWKLLLLPIATLLLFILAVGASWLISVVGYALRDLQEILSVTFSGLVYFTPIMYPAGSAPVFVQKLIVINPITAYVEIFRDAIMPIETAVHWGSWGVAAACSFIVLLIGKIAIGKAQTFVGDMV